MCKSGKTKESCRDARTFKEVMEDLRAKEAAPATDSLPEKVLMSNHRRSESRKRDRQATINGHH